MNSDDALRREMARRREVERERNHAEQRVLDLEKALKRLGEAQ